ncbi:diguanylate cyclase [Colwellia sp. MB02u-18]|uniref:diguanylate cyclase domain-containing protein n=1 Tax=unclassified Colwellia TaxID=196834 RepID=UPI0015F4210C|nr:MULTISPECIES: diguanylate cyclase [unclassified Colwellia]MBA6225648.1 diguanylate cyclase [Colwellia sp. MB3u-45]MBA6266896.1 diguanylate cyclase [Colwellia sp. MB3u-43]MBA6321808.1 diguanylate cyclase [Colwellia sp. MB02u-19]MBA6325038.1 diguanylate cyclase [Colwellia sp. MB02u-18]MBA6331403.1 diguanylate cyclase [Colwellia sp. MB02u-12]
MQSLNKEEGRRAHEQSYTLLCIDDESVNLKVLASIFKDHYNVVACKSAKQGFQLALQENPDIILLDVLMPEENGFELMAKLKKHPQLASIPVIFITGLQEVEDEEKALMLGACDYIQKPFNYSIVRARVNTHLEIIRQRNLLQRFALFDSLTELPNRRKWLQDSTESWLTAQHAQTAMVYGIIDVDHFKKYNDHYGHQQGDVVLRKIAQTIKRNLYHYNGAIFRCGGEEFYFYFPVVLNCKASTVLAVCLNSITELAIEHLAVNTIGHVSVSIGAIQVIPHKNTSIEQIMQQADERLYLVKKDTRNAFNLLELDQSN